MNKEQFVKAVSVKSGLTLPQAEAAVNGFFETVREQLGAGKHIRLAGFGRFSVKHRAAKKGRNPQTGAELFLPARNVAAFTPYDKLKEAVN